MDPEERRTFQVDDVSRQQWKPNDGGLAAWSVLGAACITNGVVLGFWNDNSVIYAALLQHNADVGEINLAFKVCTCIVIQFYYIVYEYFIYLIETFLVLLHSNVQHYIPHYALYVYAVYS
jgi:hypothetical protein